MSEYHVLCFKPTPRLEWRGDDSQDEADQFQHGALTPRLEWRGDDSQDEADQFQHGALTLGDSINEVFGTHNHIEIIPGKKRGQCEIVVVGALAQYLAFAQQKTTADSCGS
jgi:hypothetical protein